MLVKEEVFRKLAADKDAVRKSFAERIRKAAEGVAAQAQDNLRASGLDKNKEIQTSIEVTLEDEGMSARISCGARHAVYIEFGTSRINARPFLTTALKDIMNKEI